LAGILGARGSIDDPMHHLIRTQGEPDARSAAVQPRMSRLATHRLQLAGLAVALSAWAFFQLSSEMLEGDTRAFDMSMPSAAQSLRSGHPWVAEAMRDLSGLGSTTMLTLVTIAAVGYLMVVRARVTALLVGAAVITGSVAVSLLKAQFGRPRPGAELATLVAPTMSFPSGHAALSAIVFLTVAALLAHTRIRAIERAYILAMATVMALLVGVSRIALGVHWASDVAAGWAFGAAWALAWLSLARRVPHEVVEA
jgi:undecaprenyl-diphosphatase